jgi:predicted RND superfamily exporter protein
MDRIFNFIIQHRKSVIAFYLAAVAASLLLSAMVGVNYNLVDYLPAEAQSTEAIRVMKDEFGGEMPNAGSCCTM